MDITIRVYGFLIDARQRLLVSDEMIQGNFYTKLPGGGLEFGEGLKDCLRREFQEETGIEVEIGAHVYTTDYFQPSKFRAHQQFIGVYYRVHSTFDAQIKVHEQRFDFTERQISEKKDCEAFRWVELKSMSSDGFDLPTDKIAFSVLQKQLYNR